ncbi:MAG: efflux RND transporter permease subunit [Bryobacteraceae bacterium]
MWRFAIRAPHFIIVCCLMVSVIGVTVLTRMPVDMFPEIKIPVVVVATFFNGMAPEQIEADITGRYERFFTLASGIEHIESRSLPGVSLIKVYFQPGVDADAAVSTISNLSVANLRRLPQGTLPPVVLKMDASSTPVCLIALRGEGLGEAKLRDVARYAVRNQVATVQGTSVPQPFGGKYRQIMIYTDPMKLEAHGLSLMDVVRSMNEANLILPGGSVGIGAREYSVYTNSQLDSVEEMNQVPLRMLNGAPVRVADIGEAKDAAQIQTSIVRVDGARSVYTPVLRQGGDSNTIAIVDGVREAIKNLLDVPETLQASVVFDQSRFIKTAIETLIDEGVLGLLLTSVMILVFLGSFRSTLAVFFSIPLSVLVTFILLGVTGGTVNSMVLAGLALAFSRLIDNSVVVLENIHRHLELGTPPAEAAEKGAAEVALPVLAATLTTVVVFFPVTFLFGVSRFLFTALAIAVAIAMFASYAVALTVVPLFCSRYLKAHAVAGQAGGHKEIGGGWSHWFNKWFDRFLDGYEFLVRGALRLPAVTILLILGVCSLSVFWLPGLGVAFFPRTDSGQFIINVKAPSGTRIDSMEDLVEQAENIIRSEIPKKDLDMIVSNIGVTPGFSSIYTSNSASHTAFLQVSLQEEHETGSYEYMERIRRRLNQEMPLLTAFFRSGGIVDAVLNLGMPAPIDVQVSGSDLHKDFEIAAQLSARIRSLPGVSDVYTPQDVDYPALQVDVDRLRASKLGLNAKEVIHNLITALTSNQMIAPSYWVDPRSGDDYMVTVQYPERHVNSLRDFRAIPIRSLASPQSTRLDAVTDIRRFQAPTEVDRYQFRRVIDVFVQPDGEDLGRLAADIEKVVAETKVPPNVRVNLRGMVQGMRDSFLSFGYGLLLSVLLLYLILVAQFRSFTDPLLILLAVPPGLAGVLVTLTATGTTLNVMSLMGVVMLVGIVASNSILIIEFANHLRTLGGGEDTLGVIVGACRIRLRPVLMTSFATLVGLLPMALKLGAGSEAYAPLARAILGGLTLSLITTVFLVPAAYLMLYRRRA